MRIIDDYSRAVWIYSLNDEREVFRMFLMFIAMTERQLSINGNIVFEQV